MSEGGSGAQAPGPPSAVRAYVGLVGAAGLAGFAWVLTSSVWAPVLGHSTWTVLVLAAAAVIGEIRPMSITRGDATSENLSTSAPFILALLAVTGVGTAILVQVLASLLDDVLNRRQPIKSAFNVGQYAVSVLAAAAVYSWLSGEPFRQELSTVHSAHLGPLLVAGMVMVLCNRLLVAGVISLAAGVPVPVVLREDARLTTATHMSLVAIGAIAASVADDGTAIVLLLGVPVLAVHLMASSAVKHAHQASHDSLTGLGNRERLQRRLGAALLERAEGGPDGPGLVLIDLDHFKDINDTLGHPVGDRLLRQVAARLASAVPEEGSVHRLGGDEFAVLVRGDEAATQAVARDLLRALERPVALGDLELLVRASAGVAVAPLHGDEPQTLMKNADIALYHAKIERDRSSTYASEMDVNSIDRLQLLTDLRGAIDTGELSLAFQPQLDLAEGRVVGVEALIRWNHPVRGAVPPDQFIPLAENSGLITELTAYVLDAALAVLARWRAHGHDVRMAVNLSARHLSDLALPRRVAAALELHGVPSDRVVLEVTETAILSDPARVDVIIQELRRLGVGIAVDDYGTGHASLSYLKRLRIDELKVDRSFVSEMSHEPQDFVIVRSTIALARDLGLRVVAEGVEDEGTAVLLRELGCHVGQGFHLGRPVPAEAVLERLSAQPLVPVTVPTQR